MADFKTIILPVTFVSRDGAASEPMVYDQNYTLVSGKNVLLHHEAGTPLKLPAAVADEYLARFRDAGAKEVDDVGVDVVALAQLAEGKVQSATSDQAKAQAAELEKAKAQAEKAKAEADKARSEAEKAKADLERAKIEAAKTPGPAGK